MSRRYNPGSFVTPSLLWDANHEGLALEARTLALLHRGEEGIHIDVPDYSHTYIVPIRRDVRKVYPHTQNATGVSPWMNGFLAREARNGYCRTRKDVGVYFRVPVLKIVPYGFPARPTFPGVGLRQVSSVPIAFTSVFGMGTGGTR